MAEILSTSVVIGFSSAKGSGVFSAEVDSREDGFNAGKTSFYKGDAPVVLLYADSKIVLTRIAQSEGAYEYVGEFPITIEEHLTFENTREQSLEKPYLHSMQVLGSMPAIPSWSVSDNQFLLPEKMVAVVKVRYVSWFRAYRITNTSGEYPVVVYFEGVIP